jgi:hypothetical protein
MVAAQDVSISAEQGEVFPPELSVPHRGRAGEDRAEAMYFGNASRLQHWSPIPGLATPGLPIPQVLPD